MKTARADLTLPMVLSILGHVALIGGGSFLDVARVEPCASQNTAQQVVLLAPEHVRAILDPHPSPKAPTLREASPARHATDLSSPRDPARFPTPPSVAPPAPPEVPAIAPIPRFRTTRAPLERLPSQATPVRVEAEVATEVEPTSDAATTDEGTPPEASDEQALPPLGGSVVMRYRPPLIYPKAARRAGTEGTAEVGLEIARDGRVQRVWLVRSSGSTLLDRSALDNVGRWRFDPTSLTEADRFRQSVRFQLQ